MMIIIILMIAVHTTVGLTDIDMQARIMGSQFRFSPYVYYSDHWYEDENDSIPGLHDVAITYFVQVDPIHTHFNIVPGLCGLGISFQSRKYPERFIVGMPIEPHGLHTMTFTDVDNFRERASFTPKQGNYDSRDSFISFESLYYPGQYIRCPTPERNYSEPLFLDYDDGSQAFAEWSTFQYKLVEKGITLGGWKKLFGYNNPQPGDKIVFYKEEGTSATESAGDSITTKVSWGYNLDAGFEKFGLCMKGMYTYVGETSSEKVSMSTFTKLEKASTETTIHMTPGVPFYMFQWHLYLFSVDGAFVNSYSNLFYSHNTSALPPDPSMLNGHPGRFH